MRWKSRSPAYYLLFVSLFPPVRLLVKVRKALSQEYQSFNNANLKFLVENVQTPRLPVRRAEFPGGGAVRVLGVGAGAGQ